MFTEEITENSFLFILLADWIPAFLTVVVGGLLAGLILPRLQHSYLRSKEMITRKSQIAEGLLIQFREYRNNWRRLVSIAELETARELENEEVARKAKFVEDRNSARDRLYEHITLVQFHFPDRVERKLDEFICWDQDQSSTRLDNLPGPETWDSWEKDLISVLKSEI